MHILDAINRVLLSIGETPVNRIDDPTVITTQTHKVINETKRQILLKGWHFNKEDGYTLSPDKKGLIHITSDMLDIHLQDPSLSIKKKRLFNRTSQSFLFTENVKASITFDRSFEDIPALFQEYITARSIRIMHERVDGDAQQNIFFKQEESELAQQCQEMEYQRGNFNMFDIIEG